MGVVILLGRIVVHWLKVRNLMVLADAVVWVYHSGASSCAASGKIAAVSVFPAPAAAKSSTTAVSVSPTVIPNVSPFSAALSRLAH